MNRRDLLFAGIAVGLTTAVVAKPKPTPIEAWIDGEVR